MSYYRLVSVAHPTLMVLLERFVMELNLAENTLGQIANGREVVLTLNVQTVTLCKLMLMKIFMTMLLKMK